MGCCYEQIRESIIQKESLYGLGKLGMINIVYLSGRQIYSKFLSDGFKTILQISLAIPHFKSFVLLSTDTYFCILVS